MHHKHIITLLSIAFCAAPSVSAMDHNPFNQEPRQNVQRRCALYKIASGSALAALGALYSILPESDTSAHVHRQPIVGTAGSPEFYVTAGYNAMQALGLEPHHVLFGSGATLAIVGAHELCNIPQED